MLLFMMELLFEDIFGITVEILLGKIQIYSIVFGITRVILALVCLFGKDRRRPPLTEIVGFIIDLLVLLWILLVL